MRYLARRQDHWDTRAAVNFMFGGTGSCLLFAAALLAGETFRHLAAFAGLGLIALGLLMVWLEIGRPWRAANVLLRPNHSWMTREAWIAIATFAVAGAWLLLGVAWLAPLVAGGGLAFLACQAMILRAAKGVPAWHEPALLGLIVSTGLVEGTAALLLILTATAPPPGWLVGILAALLVVRAAAWLRYRGRLQASLPAGAQAALAATATPFLWIGHALPLLLLAAAWAAPVGSSAIAITAALAALGAGWFVKHRIVTRLAHLQGYALGVTRRGHPLGPAGQRRSAAQESPTLRKTRTAAGG